MKFYLCQTDVGPQYVHLQADAKKIDPDFETVDLDLSKESIMNRLNELMRRGYATVHTPTAASPEEEQGFEPPAPAPPPAPKAKPQSLPPRAARNEAQIAWEEFILDLPSSEAYRLDTLQKVITARRAEIEQGVNV